MRCFTETKRDSNIAECCVQRVMVHGSETWPIIRAKEVRRLERAERMMMGWMCAVTLKDRCKSEVLRKRLDIEDVADVVRMGRLAWFGHLERNNNHYCQ